MNSHSILLADYSRTFGGAPEFALALSKYLIQDYKIKVSLLSPQLDLRNRALKIGANPIELAVEKIDFGSGIKGLYREFFLYELPLLLSVLRAIKRAKPNIIQLNNIPNAQRSAILAAKLKNIPCIQTHQGFETASRSVNFLLPFVTHHVAISRAIEAGLTKLNIPSDRITRIPDGIDTDKFNPLVIPTDLNAEFGIPNEAKIIAIFGRVVPWKGQDVFIKVLYEIFKKDLSVYGLIVGDSSDGESGFLESLKNKVQQMGISERTIFTGRRTDIAQLMKSVDVVLHLSQEPEPLGLVVAESLAVGTPVVGMSEGGVPDMLQHEQSGFLCKPTDIVSITKSVIKLLSNKEMCLNFGDYGSKFILKEFSGEEIARKYIELYKRILK